MIKLFTKKRKGFTLIELVVVIAILGILAAIAIPRLTDSRTRAAKTAHNANVASLESAATILIAEKGLIADVTTTFTKTSPGLLGGYLQEWPEPVAGSGETDDYKVVISSTGTIEVTPGAVPVD